MAGLIVLIVIVVVLVIAFLMMLATYNGLVRGRLRVHEAWSGIDVQLKRRSSLIPNLVETVRGYASHERETFENVTRARAMLDTSTTAQQAAQANNMLTQALRSLFAVAENYPDLKANQEFLKLQDELTDVEDKIAYARQFYNRNVLSYNTSIETFPGVVMANMFRFQPEEFFEAEAEAREEVHVSFAPPAAVSGAPPAAAPPAAPPPPAEPPASPTA